MSRIEEQVCKRLMDRAEAGKKKYGTTMERNDLSFLEWINHLQEELLDAAVYAEKLREEATVKNLPPEKDYYDIGMKEQYGRVDYLREAFDFPQVPPLRIRPTEGKEAFVPKRIAGRKIL